MKKYSELYRKRGIRKVSQLNNPPMTSTMDLTLPKKSTLHHYDMDIPFSGNDILFMNHPPAKTWVDFVEKYSDSATLGNPKEKAFIAEPEKQEYFKNPINKNSKMLRLRADITSVNSEQHLLVVNYNFLQPSYRYVVPALSKYYQWANFNLTFFDNITKHLDKTNRHQFFIVSVPETIPSIRNLRYAEKPMDRIISKRVHKPGHWLISDIWNWLQGHKDFGVLSTIPVKYLKSIDMILHANGEYTILNLGILYGLAHEYPGSMTKKILRPEQVAKRFLLLLANIKASTGVAELEEDDEGDSEDNEATVKSGITVVNDYSKQQSDLDDALNQISGGGYTVKKATDIIEDYIDDTQELTHAGNSILSNDVSVSTDEADEYIDKALAEIEDNEEDDEDEEELNPRPAESFYLPYVPEQNSLEQPVIDIAKQYVNRGRLSNAELTRFEKLSTRYKAIPNPVGEGTFEDMLTIRDTEKKIESVTPMAENTKGNMDESFKSSSLLQLDSKYTTNVLHKDIFKAVMNVQKAGIAVKDYKVKRVTDFNNDYEIHTVSLQPVVGEASPLTFMVPVVNSDGQFVAKGVKSRMRKQAGDVPIRKVDADLVSMISGYSKLAVRRSERVKFNFTRWITNSIVSRGIDSEDNSVTDLKLSNVFVSNVRLPRHYTAISTRISHFKSGDFSFMFNHSKIDENFKNVKEDASLIPCGTFKGEPCFISADNQIHVKDSGKIKAVGTIIDIIDRQYPKTDIKNNMPIEFAELMLFGKPIPLGMVLAYYLGLGNLIATMGLTPIYRKKGSARIDLSENDVSITFSDYELIFKDPTPITQLIFQGFNRYERHVKAYSVYKYDKPDVYGNIFEKNGVTPRYVREFETMRTLWVDPITEEILIDRNEPTDFVMLLMFAGELLTYDQHPDAMDINYMRIKGYERISTMIYNETVKAVRQYQSRPRTSKAKVTMNPNAVWYSIIGDQTTIPVSDSNPIHSLKEKEVVVYRGAGGRSSLTMTAKNRKYHESSLGVISEATPDSKDVATVIYLTADPSFDSIRGTVRPLKERANAKMMSTSMLMAPGAIFDDPKRTNFISIQNSRTTIAKGYSPLPVRTGYESIIGHRTDDIYCKVAEAKGVVTQITNESLQVTYGDGDVAHHPLGIVYGNWSGKVIPHEIIAAVEMNQEVEKGDVLTYNKHFFAVDPLAPNQVTYTPGVLAKIALWEAQDTEEDSSSISELFADKLTTSSTHVRTIMVDQDQDIANLIKVGSIVDPDTILCTIMNPSTMAAGLFSESSLQSLETLTNLNPRAKYAGKVEKISAVYTADIDDMSESLKDIVIETDRELYRHEKRLGRAGSSAQVETGYRPDGVEMNATQVAIKVHITGDTAMGVGDKMVVSNQMKSVVGTVHRHGDIVTEDGEPIDGTFGYQSIHNRIVPSAILVGTTSTLMLKGNNLMLEAYDS